MGLADRELQEMLQTMGGVVIVGPRACGKTVTGRHHSWSEVLLDEIKRVDISRLGGREHDPIFLDRTMRSLARNTATTASIATITTDIAGEEGPKDPDSVRSYLDTLERIVIKVYHYRDSTYLEVDAVVETLDGRWAAFEIKLDARRVDQAGKSLLTFRDRFDSPYSGFLCVIVSAGHSYMRSDGVAIIAARALGP